MYSVWDRVKVKEWLDVDKQYGIIVCSTDHRDAHWMEWEITEVFGEGVWYQLSFDPSLTFDESMIELVAPTKVKVEKVRQKDIDELPSVSPSKREIVSRRLKTYQEMIDKLENVDRDMFFGMLYDKLESILYEEYWE